MRILLVDGFAEPDPMAAEAHRRLEDNGHDVTRLGLVESGFDRFMTEAERRAYHEPDNLVTPEQRASAALLGETEGLLVMSRLRAGTIDPVVKSWFERVFIPGVSFTFTRAGRITGALRQVRRVGMVVDCPDADPTPHRRNSSTRSVVRGVRLNAARTCRTSYVALHPGVDRDARIASVLDRW